MIISFDYSIKVLESLKYIKPVHSLLLIKYWYFTSYGFLACKYILSISGCWFIRLNIKLLIFFFRSTAFSY